METKTSQRLHAALRDRDGWAIRLLYRDSGGVVTRRIVSPTRMGRSVMSATCWCRQEPRDFRFDGILEAVLVPAWDVLAPVEIEEIDMRVRWIVECGGVHTDPFFDYQQALQYAMAVAEEQSCEVHVYKMLGGLISGHWEGCKDAELEGQQ